jgi:hypothetical protein
MVSPEFSNHLESLVEKSKAKASARKAENGCIFRVIHIVKSLT